MSRFPREAAVALTASLLIPAGGLAASDASAEYMAADPSITDPSPTPWERLEIGPDGQSLRVYFSTGAAGCNGLARVEIDRSADVPVVTVWTGLHPDAAVRICEAGEYDYYTEVALDAPVVLDGSTTSHTSSKGYPGRDELVGGPGRDRLFGGNHDDVIKAKGGDADFIDCGDGDDTAFVDPVDTVTGSEKVIVQD